MPKTKIAVTLVEKTLSEVDRLVAGHVFPSRSRVIEKALQEKLSRMSHNRLARECAKLDPGFEKALAEERVGEDLREWPEY
ncbi:antitoxin, RHH family [Syntrophotalea carbinolica DSM 2380]|uniref:Antitoxin, RHH family n=1 Tax=Syntrophotalea carbinolica (strain DSM 2380 / NBRC 103641 / GraBd1) TaxID=338963 RepID=Q3A5Z1_SYNC1|nr:ribbon-helix-helix domain-containing protein [Syntrophotalea carbinolica]ABA88216.1 antitoxin, RHH family [Syntrophotalea carbinolica DSM 2380]